MILKNNMKQKYKLIVEDNEEAFEVKLNHWIERDWNIKGKVSMAFNSTSDKMEYCVLIWKLVSRET